jgi:hypothetical protein
VIRQDGAETIEILQFRGPRKDAGELLELRLTPLFFAASRAAVRDAVSFFVSLPKSSADYAD